MNLYFIVKIELGSSGPLYTSFFSRFSAALKDADPSSPQSWAKAIHAGIEGVGRLGGAKLGDRTLMDALIPAAETFSKELSEGKSTQESFQSAVAAADTGVENTKNMKRNNLFHPKITSFSWPR